MKIVRFPFLLILLLLNCKITIAQMSDYSFPFISNYSPKTYGMHPRNFAATQGFGGTMFFGNAYGVLHYDGNFWKPIGLPDGISAYALCTNNRGEIFVGSVGEFGTLKPDSKGTLVYHSLSAATKIDPKNIGDITQIFSVNDTTYFIAPKLIFARYPNQKIAVVCSTKEYIRFAALINHTLFVQTGQNNLHILKNNQLVNFTLGEQLKTKTIDGIIPFPNNELAVIANKELYITQKQSLKPIKTNISELVGKSKITAVINLPKNEIGIGTSGNGLLIVNQHGQLVKHINSDKGLRKNSVNNLFLDRSNGLWIILDNGLAYTDISSPYSFVNESAGIAGMGYKAIVHQNILYTATDQGLFYQPISGTKLEKFKAIPSIHGMVRDIVISENSILCSHLNSIYEIKGTQARLVKSMNNNEGPWTTKTFHHHGKTYAIVGLYAGLDVLQFINNRWEYSHHINGFDESSRIFEIDHLGNIWVCHGNKGLFRIQLSDDLKQAKTVKNYCETNGYPNDYFNHISYVNNELCISTADGIYQFDYSKDQFEVNKNITLALGKKSYTERVVQTDPNNIWVFQEGSVLQLIKNKQQYKVKPHHKLKGEFIGSYEFIGNLNSNQFIIGAQDGFILLNKAQVEKQKFDLKPLIRKVEINGKINQVLFNGNYTDHKGNLSLRQIVIPQLSYAENALNFSFSYPNFDQMDKVTYQYAILKNDIDSNLIKWSDWSTLNQIEYPQLSEGNYTFLVRAKNSEGSISKTASYKFNISPPWYRSLGAYLSYLSMVVLLLWLSIKWILKRFKLQKEKLELRKKEELALLEQKILAEQLLKEKALIELKNQQLETQVLLKKTELASVATTLNQKKEFLSQVKKNITVAAEDLEASESKLFKQIIKKIDSDLDVNDNWDIFQLHFDEANNNFLKRLSSKYPRLTPSWLLLCAYIKLNKSNKEMAALLNISLAAVEKRRYRLKEKLALESDSKLTDFLINF